VTVERGTTRIVRVIARLNVGGPAIQAITLTQRLEARGYRTRLVCGREGDEEGSMEYIARELGVVPTVIEKMRRDPGAGDLYSLARLMSILRSERPQIVHTHAAKAGTLGRLASLVALRRSRPTLVHTFHGQSLTGYFSGPTARFYRSIERWLARRTHALVVPSPEVRDDLVRLGVAAPGRFVVIPLGFDLTDFLDDSDRARRRTALRAEWGLSADDEVVTLIARLVPIKRVDRFLRVATLLAERPRARFVIVGDGVLRTELAASAESRALGDRLLWVGFRRDIPDVCVASDVVVLTSDNEGTPVSLIEAQAAAVPVVGTDVGGVRSAVLADETGLVVAPGDDRRLAAAVAAILDDDALAARFGQAGREHAMNSFAVERLVDELDRLYRGLLSQHTAFWSPGSSPGSRVSSPSLAD